MSAKNPQDPYFSEQWALRQIGVPSAWYCMNGYPGDVVVAVVDTGVADNHEDLQGSILLPALTVVGETQDDDDHGTLVAGTIGAVTSNSAGIAGAAAVKILPVKFTGQQILPSADKGGQAIDMAVKYFSDNALKGVICLPWDVGHDDGRLLQNAILRAGAGGPDAVVVIAAGNDSLDIDQYTNWPANNADMEHVITVLATGKNDERASFSNFGRKTVHVAAPGVAILSTVPYYGGRTTAGSIRAGYRYYSGTSAAAAFVAGLVAMIRAKYPGKTASAVKKHVLASVRSVAGLKDICLTGGVVDYAKAICN